MLKNWVTYDRDVSEFSAIFVDVGVVFFCLGRLSRKLAQLSSMLVRFFEFGATLA